tara:strand:+ start:165 stop:359 length:195 start_codon:yes stop_codon:yes gene_type:complete
LFCLVLKLLRASTPIPTLRDPEVGRRIGDASGMMEDPAPRGGIWPAGRSIVGPAGHAPAPAMAT